MFQFVSSLSLNTAVYSYVYIHQNTQLVELDSFLPSSGVSTVAN